jgi:hypothetical protein
MTDFCYIKKGIEGAFMVEIKGRYDGMTVILEKPPAIRECDVIVNFPDPSESEISQDDGSLAYLFRGYTDDGIREPIVDFGEAVGEERW